jgi:dTDP-3,4-didehydro-2,6-dideoxy-alpha-D-glucose 3-reductase
MSLLNVAVWGLGKHAQNRILPALSAMDKIKLVGVCSRNSEVVDECAKLFNCYGWNNPKQMLNSTEVDIVYIATPIGVHFSLAKQSIEAGKHVWCEKPLTCSYTDTQTLVSLAKRKGQVLIESFMYLYHPQFQRVKRFVDDSKKIHSVICRFGIPTLENPGFRNNPKLCGGALWDVATYTTSALLSLFPNQQIKVLFSEIIKEGLQVDSGGRAVLRFSQGVTAYLEWGTGVAYKNEIDLWGVDGSFFTDKIFSKPRGYQPQYKIRDLNGNESINDGKQSEQFMDMFCNFIEIMGSEQKITIERKIILQRAELMNEIINFKGVENGKLEKY